MIIGQYEPAVLKLAEEYKDAFKDSHFEPTLTLDEFLFLNRRCEEEDIAVESLLIFFELNYWINDEARERLLRENSPWLTYTLNKRTGDYVYETTLD